MTRLLIGLALIYFSLGWICYGWIENVWCWLLLFLSVLVTFDWEKLEQEKPLARQITNKLGCLFTLLVILLVLVLLITIVFNLLEGFITQQSGVVIFLIVAFLIQRLFFYELMIDWVWIAPVLIVFFLSFAVVYYQGISWQEVPVNTDFLWKDDKVILNLTLKAQSTNNQEEIINSLKQMLYFYRFTDVILGFLISWSLSIVYIIPTLKKNLKEFFNEFKIALILVVTSTIGISIGLILRYVFVNQFS